MKVSGSFICPHCGSDTTVYDTHQLYEGIAIRRYRKCVGCEQSCTTTELLHSANPVRGRARNPETETCVECSRPYAYIWAAPNHLWNEVSDGAPFLCADCFSRRAESLGYSIRIRAEEMTR